MVLGPVGIRTGEGDLDIGGPRQRRLLAALLLDRGRTVPADRLIEIVWSGAPPTGARDTIRSYLARLRRALEVDGPAPLVTEQSGWRLEVGAEQLDSVLFESRLDAARTLSADPVAALATIEEALALWRDDAYVEFADDEWFAGEAVRLDELRLVAHEERFAAMLASGLYDDAVGDLGRFIGAHPLRERPRGQQMLALYRAGRQVEALRSYRDYRALLLDDIGVEPSTELRALEQQIVTRDPDLDRLAPSGRALRGYRLGTRLGEGQWGVVYRASQPSVGREVAIKVVRPELADDAEFVRRFEREAQIVARLEHPHVVPLYDYWREPGGAFLVMRLLRGGSIQQQLERGYTIELDQIEQLVEQIGGALAAAHAAGVVHRDVKPANILYDDLGNAYLSDFGIAADHGELGGVDLGSAAMVYAGPELVSSEDADATADVYAFGAVIHQLLSGRLPFDPGTPPDELLRLKSSGPLPPLRAERPDVTPELDDVIARSTEPDPDRRFSGIGELVEAFREAAGAGRPVATTPTSGWTAPNPYKGLAAFAESDRLDFFGRTAMVEQVCDAVGSSRFVVVVGGSGSGKSSIVHAGVVPALRDSGAYVASMTPGRQPVRSMIAALSALATRPLPDGTASSAAVESAGLVGGLIEAGLPDDGRDVVLVIDQFEEVFTLAEPSDRDRFLTSIADAADAARRVRFVATLRADFYHRPLADPAIGELIRSNTIAVTQLSAEDLERAIDGPAERVGATIEPALTAALIADTIAAPGSLPMLQYTLALLFDQADRGNLALADYRLLGGVGGAVARRADELYSDAAPDEREQMRRLFTRLVSLPHSGEPTGRSARRSELEGVSDFVIERLATARLVALDRDVQTREPTVALAHESLMRSWPRLEAWIDEDRDGLRLLRHLSQSAETWEAGGRDAGELYRGARLEAAADWSPYAPTGLTGLEAEFLETSIAARDAALDGEREQREQDARSNKRLRRLVVALGVVAVVAIVAGAVVFSERQRADENAAEAEFQRLTTLSTSLADDDRRLAMLVAVEAFDREDRPGSRGALKDSLMSEPRFRGRIDTPTVVRAATVHPDGETIFVSRIAPEGEFSEGTWYDAASLEPVQTIEGVEGRWHLTPSPDRSVVAGSWLFPPTGDGGSPGESLVDSDPRLHEVRLFAPDGTVADTIVIDDYAYYMSLELDGRVIIGDGFVPTTPQTMTRLRLHEIGGGSTTIALPTEAAIASGDVARDHELLVYSTWSGEVGVVDLAAGVSLWSERRPVTLGCITPCPVAFSHNGTRVAASRPDGGVTVYLATTGEVVAASEPTGRHVTALAFAEGNTELLIGDDEGSIRRHRVSTLATVGEPIDTQAVDVAVLAPGDDDAFRSLSSDGSLQRWVADVAGPFVGRIPAPGGMTVYAPDGATAARLNHPDLGFVSIFELDSLGGPTDLLPITTFEDPFSTDLLGAAYSPDGDHLAVYGRSEVSVFDLATGEATGDHLPVVGVGSGPLEYSPDGRRLAIGWNGNRRGVYATEGRTVLFGAAIWEPGSGDVVEIPLPTDFEGVRSVSWHPDGTAITLTDSGGEATFDPDTGEQIGSRLSLRGQGQAGVAIWKPDGEHLLGAGSFGISEWEFATGERESPVDRDVPTERMALAAEADVLVTLDTAGQVWFWDLQSGSSIGEPMPNQRLGRLQDLETSVGVDGAGSYASLDGADGTIIWNLDPEVWREAACEAAGRNMTRDEWARAMGAEPYGATCEQWPEAPA